MNGKGRTKGRPQKDADKRIRKVDVRFTEAEYAVIRELEQTLGINKTDLVRQRVLANARPVIINAKELICFLNNVGAELGRCGNNINQLAKYANILNKRGAVSPVLLERFHILLADYVKWQQMLDTTMRKLIRLTGK